MNFHAIYIHFLSVFCPRSYATDRRAGAFFAVKWSFFWAEQGQACLLLPKNISWWCEWILRNEHDHTNSMRRQKTERNCKKRDSPIRPTSLSNNAMINPPCAYFGHPQPSISVIPDHIHILFGFRPTQALSALMQEIKRDSSE